MHVTVTLIVQSYHESNVGRQQVKERERLLLRICKVGVDTNTSLAKNLVFIVIKSTLRYLNFSTPSTGIQRLLNLAERLIQPTTKWHLHLASGVKITGLL